MKFFLAALWLPLALCSSGSLSEDFYVTGDLDEGTHCFTIMNGTHQFGCSTATADSRGIVVKVDSVEQLNNIDTCWKDRFDNYDGGFFVYMDVTLLGRSAVAKILKSNCVRGLLLHEDKTLTVSSKMPLSDDASCPNRNGDFYKDCKVEWNTQGAIAASGLLSIAWKIQIIYLNNEQNKTDLMKCYEMFNVPAEGETSVGYPFCAVSVEHSQHAAGNSEICLRRSKQGSKIIDISLDGKHSKLCDKIGGSNYFALFPPPVQKKTEKKISRKYLLLSSRLDSFGMIPYISPGEFSVSTSIITLLAAAQGITANSEAFETASSQSKRHIIMSLFSGESFDYIGSSHMMYLVQKEEFPTFGNLTTMAERYPTITSSEIEGVVEPQHIGLGKLLHALVDEQEKNKPLITSLIKWLGEGAGSQNSSVSTAFGRMPPSTWHSLKKTNKNGVGVVLAPYGQKGYDYGRINSMVDRNDWNNSDRVIVERRIVEAASALLRVAGEYVGMSSNASANMGVDPDFVTELFNCLVVSENMDCHLIRSLNVSTISEQPIKSTYTSAGSTYFSGHVYNLLAFASGSTTHTKNVRGKDQCDQLGKNQQIYVYKWMGDYKTNESYCYRFPARVSSATSPAFLIEDYDFTNTTYSTWTESQYSATKLKLYLLENKVFDWMMVIGGVILMLLSLLVVWRCEEKTFIVDEGEQAAAIGEPL